MSYPIVDYISFSVPLPNLMSQWEISDRLAMGNLFDDRTSDLLSLFSSQSNWRDFKKSGLFNRMVRFDDIGCTYMEGDKCSVSLVQFSGQGCKFLRDNNLLEDAINVWLDRLTRIDIAIDFTTDADPEDFARSFSNQRFKTSAHETSNTGSTWYVGSYKSDRFARVYRYSDPLPRHEELRLEYQFSDGQARHAASRLLSDGILVLAQELGVLYGWKHPAHNLSREATKFRSLPRRQTKAGKEYWLYKQVLPSLIKEAEKGNIALLVDLKNHLCDIIDGNISFKEDYHADAPS